jgi:alkanesulfonate monooxygenase SsuD/methylene tetrahydromethanopterin reductase-like flavin-dependent oxidoreductase (luciferase family)
MDWGGNAPHPWVVERRDRVTFGVQTVARPDDPDPGERVLAAGRLVDSLGLDAFYVGDHPARTTEVWMHLAALAVTTERVVLGSVVNCVLYRHPVMTARQAVDLDHLSGGRTMLGLGIGWDVSEFAELGMSYPPTPERHAALEEALAIIAGVWGDEPFSYSGQHYQVANARVTPPPVQQPRPPLLIAGAGERVTLRQVARYADASNFGPSPQIGGVQTPDEVRRKFAVLERHCHEVGRPYENILRTHFTPWLMIAETETEAQAKLAHYYPNGLTEAQRHSRIVGSPEQVAAYYQSLVDAGVQHFVCQSQDAADTETFRLLAEEVAPRVRCR